MKVDYLFSNNSKLGSKLISWASSKEDHVMYDFDALGLDRAKIPSHAAVLLNEQLVVESTLSTGVRIIPYKQWKDRNNEIAKVPCFKQFLNSNEVLEHMLYLWGKSYDWKGLCFFALCFLKLIIFKKAIPNTNSWEHPLKYFCTEYVANLEDIDAAMMSPAKMMIKFLKEAQHG